MVRFHGFISVGFNNASTLTNDDHPTYYFCINVWKIFEAGYRSI